MFNIFSVPLLEEEIEQHAIQWNLRVMNSLGKGVVYSSEMFVTLLV